MNTMYLRASGSFVANQRSFVNQFLRRVFRGPVELSEMQAGSTCLIWGLAIAFTGGTASPFLRSTLDLFGLRPEPWYGVVFVVFGVAQWVAFWYGSDSSSFAHRTRRNLALAGIFFWTMFTVGAWSTPEKATLGLAIAPVFAFTAWVVYVRLNAERVRPAAGVERTSA